MLNLEEPLKTIHIQKSSYLIPFTDGGGRTVSRYVYYNPKTKVKGYAFPVHKKNIEISFLKKGYMVEKTNEKDLGKGAHLMSPERLIALLTSEDGKLDKEICSQ